MSDLIPAFVLHARDYRDTSLLIDFFTPTFGRIAAVAKGARRVQRGVSQRSILQPLQPLWIEWSGRGDLKSLRLVEVRQPRIDLQGHALFSALYINELLCRLLQREDAHAALFTEYENTFATLAGQVPLDITLRFFELRLLEELGYGISLSHCGDDGGAVLSGRHYRFDRQWGLVPVHTDIHRAIPGVDLLDFISGNFTDSARRSLKQLCRQALQPHLGDKPLQSRLLFFSERD